MPATKAWSIDMLEIKVVQTPSLWFQFMFSTNEIAALLIL